MKKTFIISICILTTLFFVSCSKKKNCVCFTVSNGTVIGQSTATTTGECSKLNVTSVVTGSTASLTCINE